jgi:hypothetical protein
MSSHVLASSQEATKLARPDVIAQLLSRHARSPSI